MITIESLVEQGANVKLEVTPADLKMFAESIFADISEYVKDHKEEYNAFLTESDYTQSVNGKVKENEHSKSA